MRWTCVGIAAVLLVPVAGAPAKAPKDFFFQKGDRIVFLGDSITEQYQYSTYLELYLTTRFPGWNLTFLNAGIGGDTATGGANRLQHHVLEEKPTALTIDFGMNDGAYGGFDTKREAGYVKNTEKMLEEARRAGVRVGLISPNAVDPESNPGLNRYLETQQRFYAPLREIADRYHARFVDQYAVTRKVLARIHEDDAEVNPFPDGVHTSPAGGLLMAHTILVGLDAPALVSSADINAASKGARTEACTVDKLEASADHVAFDRLDDALPMPVQKDWVPLLPYVRRLNDLNRYELKVTGLNDAKYKLLIDGQEVGRYTARRLARGVNLGSLTHGPIHEQGQKALRAIHEKNNKLHYRFRNVVMKTKLQADEGDRARLMKEIDERQQEIYKLAKPVTHHFELRAAR
jgi:lysophospholipase L1-like esterase